MNDIQIITGDCLDVLRDMPDCSVHCCVTSPPYWGLRSYGIGAENGEMGLESTPEEYVAKMIEVFREVRRVLRDDGTCWVNLGDSYAASPGQRKPTDQAGEKQQTMRGSTGSPSRDIDGLPAKNLVGIPWRVAFALQADGWYLRQDIIWHKPNPMPESVTDRCTKSHEYLFLLSKSARYFYDAEAIKEVGNPETENRYKYAFAGEKREAIREQGIRIRGTPESFVFSPGRNKRSVWTVPTHSFREAHFATFPPKLIEPCILAGVPAKACAVCGAPWVRVVEKGAPDMAHRKACGGDANGGYNGTAIKDYAGGGAQDASATKARILAGMCERKTVGFRPTCDCAVDTIPGTVLDPFGGAGTTGLVAKRTLRRAILIELSPEYADMARRRIDGSQDEPDNDAPDALTADLFD